MKIPVTILIATMAVGCNTPRHADEHSARPVSDVEDWQQPAVISVEIIGLVARPDRYSLPAGIRLLEAVARGGGFKEEAYTKGVRVKHKDGKWYHYDLRRVVSGAEGDPVLHDGDVVVVPQWMRPTL